jgi:hypothetical protein
MKPIRLLGVSASLLLLAGPAGAQINYFTNGVVRHQFWMSNPPKIQVEQGTAAFPDFDDFSTPTFAPLAARTTPPTTVDFNLSVFDTPEEEGDNYVDRVTALFIPAVTGSYVFFLSSDDDSDLFLSTDATPAHKQMIAQEASWSNTDQWLTPGGGASLASQKRSDQWTNSSGVAPFKTGIALVAGQKYWLEAVHHEGTGGDQVGATFKLIGDPDPAGGTPSALTGSLIGYGLTFTSPMVVATQPTNTTTYAGVAASFTFLAKNPTSDPMSGNAVAYQWYRGTTAVSGANTPSYTFVPTAADSGATFQCIGTIDPIYGINLSVTSAVATLTVSSGSVTYTNGLKIARYLGATRASLEAGNTGPANDVSVSINGAEAPVNDNINNYARRMSGWFIPPTTGNYVFFLCSDDDSDLFLSTDATAAKKTLIASESGWSASRSWTNSAGGSIVSQKRSDQWTNGTGTAPFASGIALTAGTPYYIEADHHQGGGGDNLAVLAQIAGTADPTNGAPPIPANQLSLVTSPTTKLVLTNQPHNQTVFEGGLPNFTAGATSDSEFTVLYQWQRNGTNIPGATGSSYSFTTIAADNGAQFRCVASTAEGGLSTNTTAATLTVQAAVFEPGLALMRYWINQGADLTAGENGLLGTPDFQMTVPFFEAGVNNENGDSYQNSVSGFFVPAVSQAYDFITTGDDHNDFFLSTDSNPNNKRLICQQPGWCSQLKWTADEGGGNDVNQKHSATWTNASGAPWANGISLTAGTKYYIEVWHQEGTGGDSVATTFVKHGDPDPPDNTDSAITGNLLGFNAPNTATYVTFTNQPTSQTALSGATATFTAGGVSDGTLLIGTTGQFQTSTTAGATNFVKFPNVLFQWYKNGALIPGAITSTYTTPPLKTNDSAQYYAGIRALGQPNWSNSVKVNLTVIADTNKPTAYGAFFDQNGLPVLSVSFSKTMDITTISSLANYSVSGGGASIVGITVSTNNDQRHVTLQLAALPTGPVTLTMSGIIDFSGNPLVSSTVSVGTVPLTDVDVGDPTIPDPAWPGSMWVDGQGAYTVIAQGSDIWNIADAFNYAYESKTNDFDVVVRQISDTEGLSGNSKGGLMVREDFTVTGSRNWTMNNQPTSGANSTESNTRSAASGTTASWATGPTRAPAFPNAWVRIKRTGQVLQGFWSTDGSSWTLQAVTDVSTNAAGPLPAVVYVGIDTCAHANDSVTATVLTHYYTGAYANYNSSYVAPTNAARATLTATHSAGNIVISWTPAGGTLQSTTVLGTGAAWTPVGTANPATIPISGATDKFFRVGP